MRVRAVMLGILSLCSIACATQRKDRIVSEGVVLPNSMCARQGYVAASNDPAGSRMICELEQLVGTHLPKCICRDEQQIVADRFASQQAIREAEIPKCVSNGGGSCGN